MATNLTDIYTGVKKDDANRRQNDFYPTPPLATFVLGKYCKPPKNIVEPCAGRGNISKQLQRMGHSVTSYDLNSYDNCLTEVHTPYDAMELQPQFADGVVTNPPYHKDLPRKLAEKFISEYLTQREELLNVFVLLDCRLEPQQIDLEFMKYLNEFFVPFILIFTKC